MASATQDLPSARSRFRSASVRGSVPTVLLLISAIFVIARIYALIQAPVETYPDTPGYDKVDFLGGALRPWAVPLLWNAIPGGQLAETVVQAILGTGAWLFLAATTYRLCRTRQVATVAFAVVLLCGLGVKATEWDMVLLSESLSVTFLVLLMAAVMLAAERLTPARAVGVIVVLIWWVFTRPANFTILALLIVPISVGLVLTRRRDVITWIVLPMIVVTVWSGYATTRDQAIWVQNAIGMIQDRFLPDPAAKEYLHEHGMPRSEVIEEQTGVAYAGYYSPLAVDPDLQAWVKADFKRAYLRYLILHPKYTLGNPARAFSEAMTTRSGYSKAVVVAPAVVELTLWPSEADLPFLLLAAIALGLFALAKTRSWARLLPPLLAIGTAGAWVIVTFHTGVVDGIRIQLGSAILIHIAAVLVTVLSIDALVAQRRERLGLDGRAELVA